jgi:hypothetical protein
MLAEPTDRDTRPRMAKLRMCVHLDSHLTLAHRQDEKPFDGTANTGMLLDTTELEEKAASRLKALEALRAQHTALQQEYDQLKISVSRPPPSFSN